MSEKIAILGLGYVGLPLLMGIARHFDDVIGFDIDSKRVEALKQNHDWTGEVEPAELKETKARFTANADDMTDATLFIATVPTPIDAAKRPDLGPVMSACQIVGELLKKKKATGTVGLVPIVVFESTVYPGLTEEICGTEIARVSGLTRGVDFKLGYSPERINPGDKVNRLETIKKIIAAEDEESLNRLEAVYGAVITAGLHRAANISTAECAKVLENTQRDINIALMNEMAIICERMGLRTHDVLEAAGTKWNFLKFTPGLVGGHCIGVDPYYLTSRAEELGYHPQVILSGRRINDNMPIFIAQKIMKLLVAGQHLHPSARVGVMGLSFKENVRDLRNSRVPDIVHELESFGVDVFVYDPVVDKAHAKREYNIDLCEREDVKDLDAIVLAVSHQSILDDLKLLLGRVVANGIVIDIKSVMNPSDIPSGQVYWSV
ncbi:MAG: nucleotide sugar dehydrogenase [Alphaproteobacteria bacterium]|nr:nucleotide sugar dehydrogenase [Alphaproteobacteria bacterium]